MGFLYIALLLILGFYLSSKIGKLETRIKNLEGSIRTSPDSQDPQTQVTQEQRTEQTSQLIPTAQPATVYAQQTKMMPSISKPNQFAEWLKKDFFVKLGAFLLLLALGWFVSLAFANNWIGPAGRIALGLGVGAVFLGVGVWRIKIQLHQGSIFTVLGATTVLLTIFAARELYGFFTPATGLLVMFLAVVFVAFVSVRYKHEHLAIAGLILGTIAPLFTNVPAPDAFGLFMYLLIIVAGTVWVVSMTGWSTLTPVALISVFLYGLPFIMSNPIAKELDTALLFAFLFTAIFFVTNVMSIIRRVDKRHHQAQMFTAVGTAAYLILWIQMGAPAEWLSLLYVAWALVFGMGTFLVYRFTSNIFAFYLYAGTGIALIGAATAAELSGPVLTIAYIVEIGVLLIVAAAMKSRTQLLTRLSILFAVPTLLSLESFVSSSWNNGLMHSDFVVLLLMALTFLVVATFIHMRNENINDETTDNIITLFFAAGGVYLVALVWLSTHAVMLDDIATTFSLIIYTISGIALFVYGKLNDNHGVRTGGAVLIALVVARLLFIDIWDMSLTGRIVTFFVIGILLVSTAFIRQTKKEHIAEDNIPVQ